MESKNGFAIGTELLKPKLTLLHLWGYVPALMVHIFLKAGTIPAEVRVNSDLMKAIAYTLGERFNFSVKKVSLLRKPEVVKDMLIESLPRGHISHVHTAP